jgi:hypothetical protein
VGIGAETMTALLAFLQTFWKPLCGVLAAAALWFAVHHYGATRYEAGRQSVTAEDAEAARVQQKKFDQQIAAAATRLKAAGDSYAKELEDLRAARAQPVDHIVCKRADGPRPVPAAAGLPKPDAAGSRPLSQPIEQSPQPDFDPTDALYALADDADDKIAACRMLNMAVHGMPSGP